MRIKRKNYSTEFKAKVALAALKNEVTTWKRTLLDGAADVFDQEQRSRKQAEEHIDELYKQIGWLQVESDFLSKKLIL
jgi:transposase-like protein